MATANDGNIDATMAIASTHKPPDPQKPQTTGTKRKSTEPPLDWETKEGRNSKNTSGHGNGTPPTGETVTMKEMKINLSVPRAGSAFKPMATVNAFYTAVRTVCNKSIIKPRDSSNKKCIANTSELPTDKNVFEDYVEYSYSQKQHNKGARHNLVLTLSSTLHFGQLKTRIMGFLQQQNLYVSLHTWNTTAVSATGFIIKSHYNATWRNKLHAEIHACILDGTPEAIIPEFQLIPNTIRDPTAREVRVSTRALEIQVRDKDKVELQRLLLKGNFDDMGWAYIPHGLTQYKHDDTLKNILLTNNHYLVTLHMMVVYGLTPQAFSMTVSEELSAIQMVRSWKSKRTGKPLIMSIEQTYKTAENGKWLLCCHKDDKEEARAALDIWLKNFNGHVTSTQDRELFFTNPSQGPYREGNPQDFGLRHGFRRLCRQGCKCLYNIPVQH